MKRHFIDNLYSSWVLWFDHELLIKGEAFSNKTGTLSRSPDSNLSDYTVFGSQYKQWVYDSSVPGVTIPAGVYVNNKYTARGVSGLKIDYQNGRAVFNNSQSNWNVSGIFSAKDFNIYTTTKSDEELLFETNYISNPSTQYMATGSLAGKVVAPCIFLKIKGMENEDFAFGGLDNSVITARALILSDSESDLNGVGNIFSDLQKTNFCMLDSTPLNRFGDLKDTPYNYEDAVSESFSYDKLVYVSSAKYSKLYQASIANKFPDLSVGFIDFKFQIPRWPRA